MPAQRAGGSGSSNNEEKDNGGYFNDLIQAARALSISDISANVSASDADSEDSGDSEDSDEDDEEAAAAVAAAAKLKTNSKKRMYRFKKNTKPDIDAIVNQVKQAAGRATDDQKKELFSWASKQFCDGLGLVIPDTRANEQAKMDARMGKNLRSFFEIQKNEKVCDKDANTFKTMIACATMHGGEDKNKSIPRTIAGKLYNIGEKMWHNGKLLRDKVSEYLTRGNPVRQAPERRPAVRRIHLDTDALVVQRCGMVFLSVLSSLKR